MFNLLNRSRKYIPAAIALLCTCFYNITLIAQTVALYSPFKDDSLSIVAINQTIEQRYKKTIAGLEGDNKKERISIYKERTDHLKEISSRKELVTAPEAQSYLDGVTSRILKGNPSLNSLEPHFHFSRDAVPNAFSSGEGTIVFNIGLFTRLADESQMAFVLCHELAHLYLNHSNNSIERYVATLYSKETQDALKRIKNTAYQKRTQVDNLVQQFTFRSRRHSRDHESEADSLGFAFFKNTGYDKNSAISLLALLDSVDEESFNTGACLKQRFGCEDYPFQDRWLLKEEGLLGGHAVLKADQKMEDSLKTHPDCALRIKAITPAVMEYSNNNGARFLSDENSFKVLQQRFRHEMIEYAYSQNRLSLTLFLALQLLQQQPDNAYGIAMTGKAFNSIYLAQKAHKLSNYVALPAPHYTPSYNQLLQFIQNLDLDEIGEINYYFLKPYEQKLLSSEDFVFALALSKQHNNKPEESKQWINYYHKTFHPQKYKFN